MKIFLCGPPCSGKSTIAKLTAARFGLNVVDTDAKIVEEYARDKGEIRTCGEIYRMEGEEGFRTLEKNALLSVAHMENVVIALGGGVVEMPFIPENGVFVYLQASLDTLWKRLMSRPEPPAYLSTENARKAFWSRILDRFDAYNSMADLTIGTDNLTPECVVDRIGSIISDKEGTSHGIK